MPTEYRDSLRFFDSLSFTNLANSAIGANVAVGNWGWSVTNLVNDRTLAGNESTAANIAASLATLIRDLIDRGILKGTYTN